MIIPTVFPRCDAERRLVNPRIVRARAVRGDRRVEAEFRMNRAGRLSARGVGMCAREMKMEQPCSWSSWRSDCGVQDASGSSCEMLESSPKDLMRRARTGLDSTVFLDYNDGLDRLSAPHLHMYPDRGIYIGLPRLD